MLPALPHAPTELEGSVDINKTQHTQTTQHATHEQHPFINQQVEVGEEPGLEYGDESEDELAAVSDMGLDFGAAPPVRFKLLHGLW